MGSDRMYGAVIAIRRMRGMNKKKEMLGCFPELKNILKTTYNPYMQFGLTPDESWLTGYGNEQFSQKTSVLLYKLANGDLTGTRARTAVRAHLRELTFHSGQLLIMILNKTLSFGLAAKSINDVFPGLIPTHPIQLAKPFELRKCKFPCFVSPKLDGLRSKFQENQFFSRAGHKFVGLSRLTDQMSHLIKQIGKDIEFDGELMVDGEHFNEISGKIRAFTEADDAHYHIFDVPSLAMPQYQRLAFLDLLATKHTLPNISFVPHRTVSSLEGINTHYADYLERGYEGAIVKQEMGYYQDNRTWDWMKLKGAEPADCTIIGLYEGKGKYVGMAGGLVVDYNGVEVRVGSGLTDKQRLFWWQDQEEIIGRVAEIVYHEETPAGSLRHPRFKKLRGDK